MKELKIVIAPLWSGLFILLVVALVAMSKPAGADPLDNYLETPLSPGFHHPHRKPRGYCEAGLHLFDEFERSYDSGFEYLPGSEFAEIWLLGNNPGMDRVVKDEDHYLYTIRDLVYMAARLGGFGDESLNALGKVLGCSEEK